MVLCFSSGPCAPFSTPLLLAVALLATLQPPLEAAVFSSSPELPCLLNHGCKCDHSLPFFNSLDQQTYGTCAQCDPGWTGPACDAHDVKCFNGGVKHTNGSCSCPPQWTGPECVRHQCINSVPYAVEAAAVVGGGGRDGSGAPSAPSTWDPIAPNSTTNMCDRCRAGWAGVNCGMCTVDSVCPGQRLHSCNTSIVAAGSVKTIQCDVTQPSFLGLLGGGRKGVGGRVAMSCRKEGGLALSTPRNGTCDLAFFRVEPNDEYIDAFFFCTAYQCAMTLSESLEAQGKPVAEPRALRIFRLIAQAVLLLQCALLAVVYALDMNRRRRALKVLGIAAIVSLAIFVFSMSVALERRAPRVEEFVEYACESTACRCAEDPLRPYKPVCAGSIFEQQILARIKNRMSLRCSIATNECSFKPQDVAISVELACAAAECVDPGNSRSSSPGVRAQLARYSATTAIVVVVFLLTFVVTALMHHRARRQAQSAAADFTKRFLEVQDGNRSSAAALNSERYSPQRSSGQLEMDISAGHGLMDAASPPDRSNATGNIRVGGIGSILSDVFQSNSPRQQQQQQWGPSRGDADDAGNSTDDEGAALVGQLAASSPLTSAQSALQAPFHLDVAHVSYGVADASTGAEKSVLEDITFRLRSGQACAIVGASGAGKSTLLDILAARSKTGVTSGVLRLGGVPISAANMDTYRTMVGYVAQEDVLNPSLTVRQTLGFAARLKLPAAFSGSRVGEIVDDVIASLRLQSCADTVVGDGTTLRGISGGERRRLAIGTEIIASPRILFLDEVTNSLDAVNARNVMECVVGLAKHPPLRKYTPFFGFQPIVVFSIHQPSPSIYALFDQVVVLSQGTALFAGPAARAVEMIAAEIGRVEAPLLRDRNEWKANPAEQLLELEDVLSVEEKQLLAAACRRDSFSSTDAHEAAGGGGGEEFFAAVTAFKAYYPNDWQQFSVLLRRSAATLSGLYHLIAAHASVTLVVAALLSLLYPSEGLDLPGALNRAGALTFVLLVVAFTSLSSLEMFMTERRLFVTERENGFYRTLPYLAAKLACDLLPLRILPVVCLGALIYFPMGFRMDGGEHFLWFLLILVLFSIVVTLLVLCLGMLTPQFGGAALISAVAILWNFVFCGLLIQSDTIPAVFTPFKVISPFYLAFEALLVNELDGQTCTFAPTDATGKPSTAQIPLLCVQYLYNLGLDPNNFDRNVSLLLLSIGFLLIVCYFLLALVRIRR